MSDLHLENARARECFRVPQAAIDDCTAVFLAGDIHRTTHAIRWAADTFSGKDVFIVAGNHEYMTSHIGLTHELRRVAKERGVHFLENDQWISEDKKIRVLGCVLWTDFLLYGPGMQNLCMKAAKRCMEEYQTVRAGKSKSVLGMGSLDAGFLTPHDTSRIHARSKRWLAEKLGEPFEGKTIVMTHMLPSRKLVAEKYKEDILSAAFASNMDSLVEKADYYFAGHTHTSFDLMIGKCRVVVNPRGYAGWSGASENKSFSDTLIVSI